VLFVRRNGAPYFVDVRSLRPKLDFILIVTAKDMDDFELFTRRLLFDNANIRRFSTNVVMARDKVVPV
jgi:hypothetical protein